MKLFIKALSVFIVLGLVSCNKFKTTTTAAGDRLDIHEKGKSGKLGKDGDIASFHLVIKTATDSVVTDSYKMGKPFMAPLQKGQFKGCFENALYAIGEGDSVTVLVKADSMFKGQPEPYPAGIKKGSEIKYIVRMVKIQSKSEIEKELNAKKAGEPKIIADYAAKNMPTATKTPEGLFMLTTKPGTGALLKVGETAMVNYVGKLLNGKIFDQSKGQPVPFPVGVGRVIPGFDKALLTMKIGQKTTILIPSEMAYGAQSPSPDIEPNSPLVFDLEIVGLEKK
jgi:FKBP-type peptidyl-prolyl cis-trans isomerase FkpA